MVLIVTNESDITSDYVVLELQKRGHSYWRLNTEHLPSFDIVWHFHPVSDLEIRTPSRAIKIGDVSAAYFRRPGAPTIPKAIQDAAAREYCRKDWAGLLRS